MERVGGRLIHRGRVIALRQDTFKHVDGETVVRDIVLHPGAVAIAAHDERTLYMVRQPREAVGEDALLELPAGTLDIEGETPLEAAQRELGEEVGKKAERWRELKHFYTSPGFANEQMHVFEAGQLTDVPQNLQPGEKLEVVQWPLAEINAAIDQCVDAKSLIGLLLLRESLQ